VDTRGPEPPAPERAPGGDQPRMPVQALPAGVESLAAAGARRPARATRASVMALQRSAGNAAVLRLLREAAQLPEGPATQLVDDEAQPAGGQMRKGEFLDALQTALLAAAEVAFAPTPYGSDACPWIDHWIGVYRGRDAAATEAAVRRFAPDAAAAASAQGYIAPLAGAPRG
jgi:hypothetical protein